VPYKAVVFDMDGTLLDTLEDLAGAMNRVLDRHGLPTHPVGAYRHFVGSGARELVRRTVPVDRHDPAFLQACLQDFFGEYQAGWQNKTRLYDGIADLLDQLVKLQIPMAVLTNKPQDFAQLCMQAYMSAWPFALTLGQVPGVPVKPDPAGPRQVIAHLGVLPAEILYLGDTDVDMLTAVGAGMFPVGVLWGFRPAQELLDSGAKVLLDHPLDLLPLLT